MYRIFVSNADGKILGTRSDNKDIMSEIDFTVVESDTFDFTNNKAELIDGIWNFSYEESTVVSG